VSDFEAGEKTWKDEIAMAQCLASQDGYASFPLIFVESALHRHVPPPKAVEDAFPNATIVYHDSTKSAAMKDYGVSLCTTEWVAVLEADSVPARDWLRSLLDAAAEHPEYDVITGRTTYGTDSSWQRALNLLDRSFDDHGHSQPTQFISNNGALYRTQVLRKFPYPEAETPFLSSRLRNQQIIQAGHKVYFEHRAVTRHAIGGFGFIVDFRRHTGFADMLMAGAPSVGKIPRRLAQRVRRDIGNVVRMHGEYLRWYDWPLVAALFCFARIPEVLGMLAALKEGPLTHSAYR
jgi:hypothetical protein